MSFKDAIAETNVVAESLPEDLSRFHWYHGVKQAGTAGYFFIKASAAPVPPQEPWAAFTNPYGEEGFKAEVLKIAVIGMREAWFIPNENGGAPTFITGYETGAKSNIELLCFVEGMGEEVLVLSASGKFKAGALKLLLKEYTKGLLRQAATVAGKPLPAWTFWLPVGCAKDKKGSVIYEETQAGKGNKGAAVTPPVLLGPLDMDALYVGNDVLRLGEIEKNNRVGWLKESRITNVIEGEIMPSRALPAPNRNVPQPLTDEDIPF